MSLPQILAAARSIENGFAATIPDGWMQGRTSYGGLSAALALVAAQRIADDLPPLRSATVNFVGPLAGEVEVTARLLRRGRNATWISAEVGAEGAVGLSATFVFMGSVEQSTLHLHEVPAPADLVPLAEALPLPERGGPSFAPNFERRFGLPRSDVAEPVICWWERLRDTEGLDPMVALLLLADALPPGVMPLTGPAPISSMTWLINLLTAEPRTDDGWFLLRALGNYAEKGCSSQDMAIWNTRGEAVAVGMQSIALFG
ncbi:acyl-CoA thioesterase [Novosphingobium kunmingense]|uniref:Acyl-CoA thioesterase n=1 Tax=Novosphingobium kunmingense TaxID=1211806 RepID=A0A2N0I3C9_9SPHN|nr:thioesterase family protein [Novosphingobium kunmingense]PKB25686.1 acyl-CoA thioesterase [Novosphingobium kunmingense]